MALGSPNPVPWLDLENRMRPSVWGKIMPNFYEKLLVGRYLEFNFPPPQLLGPPVKQFQEVSKIMLHLNPPSSEAKPVESKPLTSMENQTITLQQKLSHLKRQAVDRIGSQFDRQAVSMVKMGETSKEYRNFAWLEWLPGVVSIVKADGRDVLTGPMSGCWVGSIMRGGIRYVAHVGTDMTATTPNSIAAKAGWNSFVGSAPRHAFSAFNPFDATLTSALPPAQPGDAPRKCFALVTAQDEFYAIVAYPLVSRPQRMRIALVQKVADSLPPMGVLP